MRVHGRLGAALFIADLCHLNQHQQQDLIGSSSYSSQTCGHAVMVFWGGDPWQQQLRLLSRTQTIVLSTYCLRADTLKLCIAARCGRGEVGEITFI